MAYICFDIGGTNSKHALVNEKGIILKQGFFPTIHTSTEDFVSGLVEQIHLYEAVETIEGVAMSIPGIVKKGTGELITAGALLHLYGENIQDLLLQYISYPVYVENDAKCALMAELTFGAAEGLRDVVLMTVGTGIGGAVAYDRQILYGNEYKIGEFGMMRMDMINEPDKTMHDYASTAALIREFKALKNVSQETFVDARTILEEMETDPVVNELVERWAYYLATGIFNVSVSFNPQRIVIGGGISANPKLIPLIKKQLERNIHWENHRTEIETAIYRNDAGIIGAWIFLTAHINRKIQSEKGA
ncbi:ROK family protein [Marinilactibacillus kalidii]|uniref:ROK family protein n=1 Tax=Marinilactibacillus kalidii TaxID=2820274 RepID=UPI001ABE7895|nr:ROK family protein [Marinilactibacillus kalidii]